MKIALVQLNALVGDVAGNTEQIRGAIGKARAAGANLVVFPEQAILGYPAKDLLLRREVVAENVAAVSEIAKAAEGIGVIVGFAEPNEEEFGRPVYNAAALVRDGEIVARFRKRLLPTYDVFDEARYFEPAGRQEPVEFDGLRIGVTICEDLLSEKMFGRGLYEIDPVAELVRQDVDVVLNLSASPFFLNKPAWRISRMRNVARYHHVPVLYVNQVGGNDDLVFDGGSCVVDHVGTHVGQAASFVEDMLIVETNELGGTRRGVVPSGPESVRAALVLGIRDYVAKCGFEKVLLGVSGGIDSAVVAALAVEALGRENVLGVAMPSRYSSGHSVTDAKALARNLGIELKVIEIEQPHGAFEQLLAPHFDGRGPDVTEENVQARVRGTILMALSNKFGSLLLTTGNKSEIAVGYCTLYGDMAGGLAAISDVPKTMVYKLAEHMNATRGGDWIPTNILTKPPSAELRPDQHDQQSLPPYDVLDGILERYEQALEPRGSLTEKDFDEATVSKVLRLLRISEYKRQQMAPGLKVTSRAFGFGRRMPIAAKSVW